jgi:hypothetical protein
MSPAKKSPGKGLQEKRVRILRCLDAHLRYLTTTAVMEPWVPAAFGHEPRPRQTPDEWATYWERYAPPRYVSPRERPELKYPAPGPEALSEEEVKAWVAADPFVRSGLAPKTQRAMAFIATFAPRG